MSTCRNHVHRAGSGGEAGSLDKSVSFMAVTSEP